jgi:hypothetical protein
MRIIIDKFVEVMGPGREEWDEPEPTKKVCPYRRLIR